MDKIQKIVATGFLTENGKALVVKRSGNEKFLPEYFELPGGKVNFGEDPSDGLIRELMEETNLVITAGSPFRTFAYVSSDGTRHTVEITYSCTTENSTTLKLSDAHTEYMWINEEEIDNFLISEEMKKSIQAGFRYLEKK